MLMLLTLMDFTEDLHVLFSAQLHTPIWKEKNLSPTWKTQIAGSIPFSN